MIQTKIPWTLGIFIKKAKLSNKQSKNWASFIHLNSKLVGRVSQDNLDNTPHWQTEHDE